MFVEQVETGSNAETVDLSKPSLRGLITMLRDKALWPVFFEWYFGNACKCAMGLASQKWGIAPWPGIVSESIGVPKDVCWAIFVEGKFGESPGEIADVLEKLL
jgi:hypothetical protein